MLTNIRALRLHDARGLYRTWLGLFTLLNALPLLDNLRLDGNSSALNPTTHMQKRQSPAFAPDPRPSPSVVRSRQYLSAETQGRHT